MLLPSLTSGWQSVFINVVIATAIAIAIAVVIDCNTASTWERTVYVALMHQLLGWLAIGVDVLC